MLQLHSNRRQLSLHFGANAGTANTSTAAGSERQPRPVRAAAAPGEPAASEAVNTSAGSTAAAATPVSGVESRPPLGASGFGEAPPRAGEIDEVDEIALEINACTAPSGFQVGVVVGVGLGWGLG